MAAEGALEDGFLVVVVVEDTAIVAYGPFADTGACAVDGSVGSCRS